MSDALVSIIIPTYNGERFLRPALRSALQQSYRNIEVVVADDCSTDGTQQFLESAAAADPRVRVVRWDRNAGAYDNPRLVFLEARGDYVKYLLHDDVLGSDCVRDLVRGIESVPGATLAFGRRVLVDENGKPFPGQEFPALSDRPGRLDGRELGDATLESCTNLIGEVTSVLFRRADVDSEWMWQVDGRRMEVLGDLSLYLRLLARGPAYYTPKTLTRFRQHAGQTSHDPRLISRGARDWPRLIDWAARAGFLTDEQKHRRALARSLLIAGSRVEQLATGPDCGPALEAAHLALAGLAELLGGAHPDPTRSLPERAHSGPLLDRFGQELDVWTAQHPVAVAAPLVEGPEIEATVAAFRDVVAGGAAQRLLVAVPPERLEDAERLLEAALSQSPDLDVELVPGQNAAILVRGDWLAVAPRGATWHRGVATAVFSFDAVPAHVDG